jgi:hypothetical protein
VQSECNSSQYPDGLQIFEERSGTVSLLIIVPGGSSEGMAGAIPFALLLDLIKERIFRRTQIAWTGNNP